MAAVAAPLRASAQGISLIRDAEIESTIRAYVTPLLQTAGIAPRSIEIFLVDDARINAFVTPGGHMFVHTGLFLETDDPLEVIGVLAHEAAHIAAGHTVGRADELRSANLKTLAATLLGIGASVLAGDGRLGAAVTSAGADIALKGLLSYTRSQEQAADQAAVTYLRATEQSPSGLLTVMGRLQDQEVLLAANQDPYLRTHPLSRDRIAFLERAVRESPYGERPAPPDFQEMHARARAKILGFLQRPQDVERAFPDPEASLPARYAHAISRFRRGELESALTMMDALLAERPQDPFFHELRGQMLLENGRIAQAVPSYRKAVELRPEEPELRVALAQALIEGDSRDADREALEHLRRALAEDAQDARAWRLAAIAHGRLGEDGQAALALAEMNFARAAWRDARGQAARAMKLLPESSPGWLRASDIAQVAEREQERAERRKN